MSKLYSLYAVKQSIIFDTNAYLFSKYCNLRLVSLLFQMYDVICCEKLAMLHRLLRSGIHVVNNQISYRSAFVVKHRLISCLEMCREEDYSGSCELEYHEGRHERIPNLFVLEPNNAISSKSYQVGRRLLLLP